MTRICDLRLTKPRETIMQIDELIAQLQTLQPDPDNTPREISLSAAVQVHVYPNSIHFNDEVCYFVGRDQHAKALWLLAPSGNELPDFEGEPISAAGDAGEIKRCALTHRNAGQIRQVFDFTRPVLLGLDDSFGYGDRLGIANPAHIRIGRRYAMRPILAQQSIRELQRTQREAEEVMDAATWAVFQEGYHDGFGADADHLKTEADIDRMVAAGFTFFTFDPSDYVVNEADVLQESALEQKCHDLPWDVLDDSLDGFLSRYAGQTLAVSDEFVLQPDRVQVLRALVKYGGVIAHAVRLSSYLKGTYPNHPAEFELSVDETESVTSPFEHYLVVNELNRLNVALISLAPRFVGDFEKGIDYKGNSRRFKEEYLKHVSIAELLGPYKISIHSGSDKFSVYEVIGSLGRGHVHVKTAGTSYLEALRTVAAKQPDLFREILEFARGLFETEKATYHVSAKLEKVPASKELSDDKLTALFDDNDARQVLHVTFGKVLTTRNQEGKPLFRDRIMQCLEQNEAEHYANLVRHFERHLRPFSRSRKS